MEVNLVYLSDSEKAIVAEIMRMKMGFLYYTVEKKWNQSKYSLL